MKYAFKTILATAALVSVGAAQAASGYAWNAGSGTGSLTFSTDALSALSSSGSSVLTATTIPALGATGLTSGAVNTAVYTKATGNVALTFNAGTAVGDTLTNLTAANSLVNIRRSIINDDDSVSQYNIYMANFKVDLSSSTIFADLYSNTGTGTTLKSYGNLAIFTASTPGVTGGTGGNIVFDSVSNGVATGHASGSLNGSLIMNSSTANLILTGLGLDTTGSVANLVKTANWGGTSASGVFTAPASVPEPSSYALMGLGLLGIGWLNRRRHTKG